MMYVKETGKITNSEYQKILSVSKSTATRELNKLINKGLLLQIGDTGKGTFYKLKGSQTVQRVHKELNGLTINKRPVNNAQFYNVVSALAARIILAIIAVILYDIPQLVRSLHTNYKSFYSKEPKRKEIGLNNQEII